MPALMPDPCPPPSDRVAAQTKALVREGDVARSAVVQLDSELMVEREEACQTTEGKVTELRGSLVLLDPARDAARSKLHEAQQLIVGASSSLPSFPCPQGRVFHFGPP